MTSWSPPTTADYVSENWSTVLLSLRDLRRDVPINYNQYPGISLTPACFPDGRYTSDKADCVAGLIAIGYRNFELDLYLDGVGGGWGICPDSALATSNSTTSTSSNSIVCSTPTFNATTLLTIFDTWMTTSNTDLGARILVLTLNLHSTNTTSTLSTAPPLINTFKSANIYADAYTPTHLLSDRLNLSPWTDDYALRDAPSTYYTTTTLEGTATDNGWPSEHYLEFVVHKRVLITYGSVDRNLPYDATTLEDTAVIFPAGYIGAPLTFNGTAPRCYFDPEDMSVVGANNSWAQVSYSPGVKTNITDLVNCGYSTLLDPSNATSTSSDEARFEVFKTQIADTAAWAWESGQPVNITENETSKRCAAMRVSDGRWSVRNCGERWRAACRGNAGPYEWSLSADKHPYTTVPASCTFAAPRTPLENAHLFYYLSSSSGSRVSPSLSSTGEYIWLDLNSLSTPNCWVSGGANATCPYTDDDDDSREVIVSAVAAVIVLVVAGLMWFAKGASWRVKRSRRRRRRAEKKWRGEGGGEYEGVPA